MLIREIFFNDVTRDIPPVVYFHEQSPEKLKAEVEEYIITGGYPKDDPRARRIASGIHEQFVHLLNAIASELEKKTGPALPACWISGFYGSGKSSFAKLLGLALDGKTLPGGRTLADALLARDDSPLSQEFVDAWKRLTARLAPVAVVFDIGGVARDDEHIHSAAVRQLQARLGYCPRSDLVAESELRLEKDGQWEHFLVAAEKTLKKPWDVAKLEHAAEDHFSHVMHVLDPVRYRDAMSWLDARVGARTGAGSSVSEAVSDIEAMMRLRRRDKTLFIVVDEVSQYVHQVQDRMLKLQSFASELGQKLKGGVWLLATGQQKLEDAHQSDNLGKLKDRFPPHLRVHLHPSNIRDVVHKRLLAKRREQEPMLRELFQKHRADLKLNGYGCEEITEEEFLEVYPMLPSQVDLLMQITSSLRSRSSRVQGDAHAIRGLLQLLGELFREQKLGEREVGELVTLDAIFEVQQSALDPDAQATLVRIFDHPDVRDDRLAMRAVRAVTLLELIQETEPTTAELVARCLYKRLGDGNQAQAVSQALERLRDANLLSYSEKHGYKLQSSAGQEWERERIDFGVTGDQVALVCRDRLKALLAQPERPRYKGRAFPWAAFFSDGRNLNDDRLQDSRDDAAMTLDFRFLRQREDRAEAAWVQKSDHQTLRDRLVWVIGESGSVEQLAREHARSAQMCRRYGQRRESLPPDKQRLLLEEEARFEELDKKLGAALSEVFLDGRMYFRGRPLDPRTFGATFAAAAHTAAERVLPELFPYFTEIAVSDTELNQLLDLQLSGPSTKFLSGSGGLGILELDAGKYVATCSGAEPSNILAYIEKAQGVPASEVISHFGHPPYGYPLDVVRACLAGLLRAHKIRIRPEEGPEITSINDPGTRDLFRQDRAMRRADLFPASEDDDLKPKDRIAIRKFFEKFLGLDLENVDEAFTDAVYQQFPGRRERLREVEALFDRLPGRPPLPAALAKLANALEDCRRSRQVLPTVKALKRNLEALRDGLEQLSIVQSELTEDAVRQVNLAAEVRDVHAAQLRELEAGDGLEEDLHLLAQQLEGERPWRGIKSVAEPMQRVREQYAQTRGDLLADQTRQVEEYRLRVKARTGFETLTGEEQHTVLRPLALAGYDTTADAVSPKLVEMKGGFALRLARAEEQANDLLDEILSRRNEVPVVRFDVGIRGRELTSAADLEALLTELRERLGRELAKGCHIRLT